MKTVKSKKYYDYNDIEYKGITEVKNMCGNIDKTII